MHAAVLGYLARQLFGPPPLPPRRAVLELGSRDVNGSCRQLFAGARYLGVDVAEGTGVDLVADAATVEPPFTPDTVVCCEVLEHTPDAVLIIHNAARVLAPGGLLLLTCAGEGRAPHSGQDGGALREDEWYRNIADAELADWLRPFATWKIESAGGDLRAVAWKGASDGAERARVGLHDL